jgi:hypothetical protein
MHSVLDSTIVRPFPTACCAYMHIDKARLSKNVVTCPNSIVTANMDAGEHV